VTAALPLISAKSPDYMKARSFRGYCSCSYPVLFHRATRPTTQKRRRRRRNDCSGSTPRTSPTVIGAQPSHVGEGSESEKEKNGPDGWVGT